MTITTSTAMTTIDAPAAQEPCEQQNDIPEALRRFLWDIQSMVELADSDREILLIGSDLMHRLLSSSSWLPPVFANPSAEGFQQFQVYHDDLERFTVVVSVLASGQSLPIVQDDLWEIIGVVQGTVEQTSYSPSSDGRLVSKGPPVVMPAGKINTRRSKSTIALQLRNASEAEAAISIHVHGGEISQLPRRILALDGSVTEASAVYANAPEAPPYDIRSIQIRIVD